MSRTEKPLNFLIICTDQMQSFTMGCNGNTEVRTTNLDQLARTGCNFQRAYCTNSVCSPSRATIFTGLTARQHGCITNGDILPVNIPTIAKALSEHDYRTHSVGKLHLQPAWAQPCPENRQSEGGTDGNSWENSRAWKEGGIKHLPAGYYGFQTTEFVNGHVDGCYGDYENWLKSINPQMHARYRRENCLAKVKHPKDCWQLDVPAELHYNTWITDRTVQYLSDLKHDESFFIWCSFPDPHHPYAAAAPYNRMYDPASVRLNATWQDESDPLPALATR